MKSPLGQRLRELQGPLLLTGHTGFKGTWMTFLLEHLEVPVVGYSLAADRDSLFDRSDRSGLIPEAIADIRDYDELERFISTYNPSETIIKSNMEEAKVNDVINYVKIESNSRRCIVGLIMLLEKIIG